jgi:hypothetical protein
MDIEKAFYTTWHSSLLYKLPELEYSARLMELIAFFLTNSKGASRILPCPNIVESTYCINNALEAPRTHFTLFADDSSIYATGKHESCVCKLQRGFTAVKP